MKTVLARSTAGIALIASLMGTAHAQDIEADPNGVEALAAEELAAAELVTVELALSEDEDDAEAEGPWDATPVQIAPASDYSIHAYEAPVVPTELLDAFVAIDGGVIDTPSLAAGAAQDRVQEISTETGIVTLRAVTPNYRDINPFYGTINPFYGDIGAFWGTINPFYGTINPFYGDINPFWKDINPFYGDINPFYGDIGAFWGDINPFYGDIVAFESNLTQLGDFWATHYQQIEEVEKRFGQIRYNDDGSIVRNGKPDQVMAAIAEMVAQGESQFGAAYTAKTGQSFDALVTEVFNRHGATSATNKSVIETFTPQQRAALYLDWHDTINQYSGVDAIDHWMAAINWTPAITQVQGDGREAIIGIIDGSFSADADLGNNVIFASGNTTAVGGHGAGVASLGGHTQAAAQRTHARLFEHRILFNCTIFKRLNRGITNVLWKL